MRIENTGKPALATPVVTPKPGAGVRFVLPDLLPNAPSAPSVSSSSIGALASLDAMIALQANGDSVERKRKAARRGHDILDGLDRLKIAMLSGRISPGQVQNLMNALKAERNTGDDPKLDELIAHIELRAEVELAKLGQR